jgi:hypothetical protein
VELSWELHGGDITAIAVERRQGDRGAWERTAQLARDAKSYRDSEASTASELSYRVRALNQAGESAYSNVVRIGM